MTTKCAVMLGLAALLIPVPSLTQEVPQSFHQKVQLLAAPPTVETHQQSTDSRRSIDDQSSFRSAVALCPLW
jgi:hypothetical protein